MKKLLITICAAAVAVGMIAAFAGCSCYVSTETDTREREAVQFRVVQWNIGHFAHGKDKRTAITPKASAARSAEYRAMIAQLKPDFLGVSEFDPVFDKAGRLTTNEVFAAFPTKVLGPKNNYQCNALFTHFKCVGMRWLTMWNAARKRIS